MPGEATRPANPLVTTSHNPTGTFQPGQPNTDVFMPKSMLSCASKAFFSYFFFFFWKGEGHSFISGINITMKIAPVPTWMMLLDMGSTKGKPEANHLRCRCYLG